MTLTSEDELPTDVGEESGVFLSVGAGDAEATKYTSRLTFFLPLLQVLLGVLCVILQIFVVVMETNAHYVTPPDNAAPGIWCGALVRVTKCTFSVCVCVWRGGGGVQGWRCLFLHKSRRPTGFFQSS